MEGKGGLGIVSQAVMCVLRPPDTQLVGIKPERRAYRAEIGKREMVYLGYGKYLCGSKAECGVRDGDER